VSRAAALALAVVFAWSSIAKLVTRPDMTELGLPAWAGDGTALVEAVLATTLLVRPADGGIAALVVLTGFTTFLVRRLNTGTGCGCFGTTKAEAVTAKDLARNAALLALAALAAFA
jgi:hypothetical protein